MASANAIEAGRAAVEVFLRDLATSKLKRLEARFKSAGRTIGMIGGAVTAGGMAILAPLQMATSQFAESGDALNKMSARTGVSVEVLSQLKFAAEQSGAGIEVLETGVRSMQRKIAEAAEGSQGAVDALDKLGLSARQLQGQSPDEQFKAIAQGISGISDPTLRAAASMDIFSRAGSQLLPMMADGAAGIEALQNEAHQLGLTMSTEDADAAAAYGDAMNRMGRTLEACKNIIGAAVAPVITDLAGRITTVIVAARNWIDENRELFVAIVKISAIVVGVGMAITLLGAGLFAVGVVFGGLASAAGFVVTVLSGVVAVVGAILSPVGLVSAAVIGLAGYLLYTSGAGGDALQWLGEVFEHLKESATRTFKGISDALAAGDIKMAAKILWLSLKAEWAAGVHALNEIFVGAKDRIVGTWTDAMHKVNSTFTQVVTGMRMLWAECTDWLVDRWKGFQQMYAEGAAWVIAKVQGLDPNEAIANVRDDYERQKRQRDQAGLERLVEIDRESRDALAKLEADRRRAHGERQEAYTASLAETAKAIDTANRERDGLLAKAADAAEQARMRNLEDKRNEAQDASGKPLPGLSDMIKGSFSAYAAERIGQGSDDRVANATEATAKNTRKIAENTSRPLAWIA